MKNGNDYKISLNHNQYIELRTWAVETSKNLWGNLLSYNLNSKEEKEFRFRKIPEIYKFMKSDEKHLDVGK